MCRTDPFHPVHSIRTRRFFQEKLLRGQGRSFRILPRSRASQTADSKVFSKELCVACWFGSVPGIHMDIQSNQELGKASSVGLPKLSTYRASKQQSFPKVMVFEPNGRNLSRGEFSGAFLEHLLY